jgi:hypothetical protein
MDADMQKQRRISEAGAATLDTRGMQPPEPILAILKEVSKSKDALRVRLDNLPMQLYDLLSQHGFIFEYFKNADGTVEGLVRPRDLSANASH